MARILERMRSVLTEEKSYPYLMGNAVKRLETARNVWKNSGPKNGSLAYLGGFSWCLFPWLGTRSFRALRKALMRISPELGISGIDYDGCYYLKLRMERGTPEELLNLLAKEFESCLSSPMRLVSESELPVFEKYDRFIPAELLRSSYVVDKLNSEEASIRILNILNGAGL